MPHPFNASEPGEELSDLPGADAWNVRNAVERLTALQEAPWAGYDKASAQRVTKAMLNRLNR